MLLVVVDVLTVLFPSVMAMETFWLSSTPVVVPEMETEDCSAALMKSSLPSLMSTEMVGATPSITSSALSPREPVSPGAARVRMAALPAASLMVPPLRARAVEES